MATGSVTKGTRASVKYDLARGEVRQGAAGIQAVAPVVGAGSDLLTAQPGRVVALEGPTGLGSTRIGLSLLAPLASQVPIAVVDVRGWICPPAAWEMGIRPEQLLTIRCDDPIRWPQALAALLEGINGVYAEVPAGIPDQTLRRLAALARARHSALVLRPLQGTLPAGIPFLRIRPTAVRWRGPEAGHGRLAARVVTVEATGKAVSGMARVIEMEDDGTNIVHMVSGMAPPRRAAG